MFRRALKRSGVLLLGIAVLVAGLWLARAPLAIRLARRAAERAGLELSVGSVSGSWLSDLELADVELAGSRGEPRLVRLVAPRARAHYSLADLVRGKLLGLHALELDVSELELDLGARGSARKSSGAGPLELPERLPRVALRADRIALRLGSGSRLEVRGLNAGLGAGQGDGQALHLVGSIRAPAPTAAETGPGRTPGFHSLELAALWRARRLEVGRLAVDGQEVSRSARVDLSALGRGELSWKAELTVGGGTLVTDGRVAGTAGEVLARVRAVEPGPLLELWPGLRRFGIGGRLEQLQLELGWDGMGLPKGSAALVWDAPRAAGYTADRIEARAELDGGVARVDTLELARGANRLTARDLFLPQDALGAGRIDSVLSSVSGHLEVDLRDLPSLLAGGPIGERLAQQGPHRLQLSARATGGRLELERGRFETASGAAEVLRGSLDLPAAGGLGSACLDLLVEADFGDAALGADLDSSVDGFFHGTLELEGPLESLTGDAHFEGSQVDLLGLPLGQVAVDALVDGESAHVERLSVQGPLGTLELRGRLRRAGRALEDVALGVRVPDLAALGVQGLAGGPLELDARLGGTLDAPTGEVVASAGGLDLWDQSLRDVELSGRLDWPHLECQHVAAASDLGSLAASGRASWESGAFQLDLADARFARGQATVELAGPAAFHAGAGRVEIGPLELGGTAGRLAAHVVGEEGAWTARAELDRFEPMVLLGPLAPPDVSVGAVDGELDLSWQRKGAGGSARLALEGLRFGGDSSAGWGVDLDAELAQGELAIRRLAAVHPAGDSLRLTADLPFDPRADPPLAPGDVRLDARADRLDLARWIPPEVLGTGRAGGLFSGHLALSGTWRELTGEGELRADDFVLDLVPDDEVQSFGPTRLVLSLAASGDDLTLRGSLDSGDPARPSAQAEARVQAGLDAVALLRDRGLGLRQAPLEGQAELLWPDLLDARRLVSDLPRATGSCRVSATLAGSLGQPHLAGELAVAEGSLRGLGDFPGVSDLGLLVRLDGERLEVVRCQGELGGAPASLRGGARLSPGGAQLDLALTGENALILRSRGLRLRADADVTVKGPLEGLDVAGTISLTDGKYARNFDPLSVLDPSSGGLPRGRGVFFPLARTGPLAAAHLDLLLRSKEPLVVKSNLLQSELRPDARLVGTGRVPELRGRIYIDSARLLVPAGRIDVRGGAVVFREDDPFVPKLEIAAEARIRGYQVSATVSGDYDRPEVLLSSVPPLPQKDLLSLVLTGQLSNEVRADQTAAAETVAVYLARDYFRRWMSDEEIEDTESFVERFDYHTDVDPTRTGVETQLGSFRLTADPEASQRHYLVVERDAYEKFNFGYRILFRFR